ncbi:MHS family MFS transporter [Rhodococcus opacus]|nr:MHS family MFS transporter [Rhodococcus opacus]
MFNRVFFPYFDPVVGTLPAFLTFAAGFVVRPLGAGECSATSGIGADDDSR